MPTLADVLGVKRQLLPGEEPTPNPDALAALLNAQSEKTLAPNQFMGSALTRQNKVGPDGAVSLDYTPSEYNKQLDTQNAEETAFEQKLSDESRQADAEENDPYIKAARAAELQDKLTVAGEPNRVAGEYGLQNEAMKAKAATDVEAMKAGAAGAPKYGQQEQAMIDSAQGINALGVPLLHKYETKFPGISQEPTKFGAPANGNYGGVTDALAQKGRMLAYTFGMKTDQDEMLQDTAAIQALAVRALSQGRITKPVMEMIQQHLPQPGFSPGANYVRLNELLTTILPGQLQGMNTGHSANPLILSPDPMSQIVGPR